MIRPSSFAIAFAFLAVAYTSLQTPASSDLDERVQAFFDGRRGTWHDMNAVRPKLVPGGCFTAHNVSMWQRGNGEFLDALQRLPDGKTTIDRKSSSGLSITCKTS